MEPDDRGRRIWPLALMGRLRGSALLVALAVAFTAALLPLLNFVWVLPDPGISPREVYESVVIALINSGVIGYCCGLLAWVFKRFPDDLVPLQPLLRIDAHAFASELSRPLSGRELTGVLLTTALVWYLVNVEFGMLGRVIRGDAIASVLNLWNVPFFLLLWLVLIYSAALLMRLANRLYQLGRSGLRIDLLATHRLAPFMEIGQRPVLLAVGGLAFALAQGALLGGLGPADWVPATLLVIVISAWLVLRPVWGLHLAIMRAREGELSRLDAAIGYHEQRTPEQLTDDRLESLLRHRERVLGVSEWPITRSAWWRPVLYFVIPPLAWVAAALVETLIDASL